MKSIALLLLCVFTAAFSGACSPPAKINANMLDATIREKLATVVQPGMTRSQVESGLDTEDISKGWRLWYPAEGTRPPVLLARLYPPGGFWLGEAGNVAEWVDVSFVFDDGTHLSKTLLFRDGMRYIGDMPANPPNREPAAPFRPYPAPPPPPKDPLQGAK